MTDLRAIITHAVTIATSRHEDDHTPPGPLHGADLDELLEGAMSGHVETILGLALDGSMAINTPSKYACVIDAQTAFDFLSKARHSEKLRHHYQAAEYRAAAERKLSEAASWLF